MILPPLLALALALVHGVGWFLMARGHGDRAGLPMVGDGVSAPIPALAPVAGTSAVRPSSRIRIEPVIPIGEVLRGTTADAGERLAARESAEPPDATGFPGGDGDGTTAFRVLRSASGLVIQGRVVSRASTVSPAAVLRLTEPDVKVEDRLEYLGSGAHPAWAVTFAEWWPSLARIVDEAEVEFAPGPDRCEIRGIVDGIGRVGDVVRLLENVLGDGVELDCTRLRVREKVPVAGVAASGESSSVAESHPARSEGPWLIAEKAPGRLAISGEVPSSVEVERLRDLLGSQSASLEMKDLRVLPRDRGEARPWPPADRIAAVLSRTPSGILEIRDGQGWLLAAPEPGEPVEPWIEAVGEMIGRTLPMAINVPGRSGVPGEGGDREVPERAVVHFTRGQSEVPGVELAKIETLCASLAPDKGGEVEIRVIGYASGSGSEAGDGALGRKRALAVIDAFRRHGLDIGPLEVEVRRPPERRSGIPFHQDQRVEIEFRRRN